MVSSVRDQLQRALGAAYTLDRELGGGGMSRVFVARDESLGRDVVVKVLAPELGEGLSAERFTREIRLAAGLQQANIVPVLAAGVSADGLPYYTMPYVEGESLRARIEQASRTSERIPRETAVGVLRDVLRALAYAHARGIVHRDVKPENVLLSGGVAVVTDFGIAKALQAAKTVAPHQSDDAGESGTHGRTSTGALTQVGTSIGTPAYMAPEQAAGDPDTDHRADLYAWGVMAYELLAGRHQFADRTSPQALMAAHIAERPAPLPAHVPPALAAVVMSTLAKSPAERPASAESVLAALDSARDHAVRTSGLPTRAVVARALGLYAAVVALVVIGTPRLMDAFGLPDWVLPVALGLVALGLPLVLLALYVRHQAQAHGLAPDAELSRTRAFAVQARPHLRLRRVAWAGVATFALFGLLVAGYMALRVLGIGPAGSLLAAGTLSTRDTLLVADFLVAGPDTALGPVMAEAVRADLVRSRAIRVAPLSQVVATLKLMKRDPAQPLREELAREVAERRGIKAVVSGQLTPLGTGYVVGLRLLGAQSGDVLASFQEVAKSPDALIATLSTLTRALRGKIGESLSTVRADPPLNQVTTASLPALRKFTAAIHAGNVEADHAKALALFREAVSLDSTFALAHSGMAIALGNLGVDAVGRDSALARAYRFRERLSERERLTAAAQYFSGPGQDRRQAAQAYEAILAADSTRHTVMIAYANLLGELREFARAEAQYRRSFAIQPLPVVPGNLAIVLRGQGRYAASESTLAAGQSRWPAVERIRVHGILSALDARTLDSAAARAERLRGSKAPPTRISVLEALATVALERGRPAEAEQRLAERRMELRAAGDPDAPIEDAVRLARVDLWTREAPARAVARLDAAVTTQAMASLASFEERQGALDAAAIYAAAGAPAKAQAILAAIESASDSAQRRRLGAARARVRAELALAAGRAAEALALFRASDVDADGGPATDCATCVLPDLARAAERAGWTDSARTFWTQYAEQPATDRHDTDAWRLARAYERLGALWAAAGDAAKAARYDALFVALRARAEPELQRELALVRQRLATHARR